MTRIYLITNTENGKQYIGQTSRTIDQRLEDHRRSARCGSDKKLHVAMREYPRNCFKIELLDEVNDETAADVEDTYILAYDTIENGYNGRLNRGSMADPYLDEMVKLYNSGVSKIDIDRRFGFKPGFTTSYFRTRGIPVIKKKLKCWNGTEVYFFDSLEDARDKQFPSKALMTFKPYVSRAANSKGMAYKYFWEWVTE